MDERNEAGSDVDSIHDDVDDDGTAGEDMDDDDDGGGGDDDALEGQEMRLPCKQPQWHLGTKSGMGPLPCDEETL